MCWVSDDMKSFFFIIIYLLLVFLFCNKYSSITFYSSIGLQCMRASLSTQVPFCGEGWDSEARIRSFVRFIYTLEMLPIKGNSSQAASVVHMQRRAQ